jgi:glycosyltransferase involved in cell wall biosynthesis
MMPTQIGYFAPEFPAQTHIFLWREIQALAEIGIKTDLISTRMPKTVASFTWAEAARKQTTYLIPFSQSELVDALTATLQAGLGRWWRCLRMAIAAEDLSFSQKLRLLAMIPVAGKLVWLARTRGWTHLHVSSCADSANIAMLAAMLSDRLTYSLALFGPTLDGYGPNQAQKWRHAAFGFTVSKKLFQTLQAAIPHSLPQQVQVASVGVNLDIIKRHTPYIPWSQGVCNLYCCGRLNPIKGHHYLVMVAKLLRQQGIDVRLQIAGEDELGGKGYRLELEQVIRSAEMSDYVALPGAVSEEQNRQNIEEAHIFALASLNEGIAVAVMEAMAMEVPVVATDVGGMAELIDSGDNAILVPPEQPQQMADAILQVLRNPSFALQLSQRSREKVAAEFHHRRTAQALAVCLADLTNR